MTERNNLVTAGGVGGDADPATIEKVYVGIPDALLPDQVIRLQALSIAAGLIRLNDDNSDEIIAAAAKFEAFISSGEVQS